MQKIPTQLSVTSAAEVGKNTMESTNWPDSLRPHNLWNMLDASKLRGVMKFDIFIANTVLCFTIDGLSHQVMHKLCRTLQECAQLESVVRDSSKLNSSTKQKQRLDPWSAQSLDSLAEADAQLAWGYVLWQLQQVGA